MYSDVMGRGIWFYQKYDREQGPLGISSDCFDVSAVMGSWGMALSDTS